MMCLSDAGKHVFVDSVTFVDMVDSVAMVDMILEGGSMGEGGYVSPLPTAISAREHTRMAGENPSQPTAMQRW